jgi:hypothetical protein
MTESGKCLTVPKGNDKIQPAGKIEPPSSRGPGRNPFKVKTGVRISVGAPYDTRFLVARINISFPLNQRVEMNQSRSE